MSFFRRYRAALMLTTLMAAIVGCSNSPDSTAQDPWRVSLAPDPSTGRWYSSEQLASGRQVFAENCAVCHGRTAASTPRWKQLDASGNYPPPPLNGSAHAWHHSLSILAMTIANGGRPVGGMMPAFKDRLSEAQISAVIASFQDYWPDEIYDVWLQREKSSRH